MSRDIEIFSATWSVIKGHAETEIEMALARLEISGFSDTEFERGRIRALRDILKLPEPDPVMIDF